MELNRDILPRHWQNPTGLDNFVNELVAFVDKKSKAITNQDQKLARERFQAIEPNAIEDFKIIRPADRVVLWHMDQSTSSWSFTSLVETHR